MVHTVTTFITSPSWTSCGRYIEISLTLTVLEDLLNTVDRMDVLKGNLNLQCNRYSKIDYPKINSIKFTTFSVNTKQKWIQKLLLSILMHPAGTSIVSDIGPLTWGSMRKSFFYHLFCITHKIYFSKDFWEIYI